VSLDYNLKAVRNLDELWKPVPDKYQPQMFDSIRAGKSDGPRERLQTEVVCVIFAMMPMGIPRITEANKREVMLRLELWQNTVGALMSDDKGDVWIGPEWVERLVGLSTNNTSRTWAQFCAVVRTTVERRVTARLERAAELAAIAARAEPEDPK
jgi:hypothetical protein